MFGEQYSLAVDEQGLTKVLEAHRALPLRRGRADPVERVELLRRGGRAPPPRSLWLNDARW